MIHADTALIWRLFQRGTRTHLRLECLILLNVSLANNLMQISAARRDTWGRDWLQPGEERERNVGACHKNSGEPSALSCDHGDMSVSPRQQLELRSKQHCSIRDGHTHPEMGRADNILYLTVFKYISSYFLALTKFPITFLVTRLPLLISETFLHLSYNFLIKFSPTLTTNTLSPVLTKYLYYYKSQYYDDPVPGVTWCRAPDQLACFMIRVGGVWWECEMPPGGHQPSSRDATHHWDVTQSAVMIRYSDQSRYLNTETPA